MCIRDRFGAGGGGQALAAVFAHPPLQLPVAGGAAEVGGGPPHVVDIPLEAGVVGHPLRLFQHRLGRAAGDVPPLVDGDGAEVAAAEATPVVDDGELHLRTGGHPAQRLVAGVVGALVGQRIDPVQLLPRQGAGGGRRHQHPVSVLLHQQVAGGVVALVVLNGLGFGIAALVLPHLFKAGALHIAVGQLAALGKVDRKSVV